MDTTSARTDSILGVIQGVANRSILLPEFQRDFRWELERTYDLFDSLARGIFIGTLIYGKPSFAISCRELDTRPRKGKGSRAKLGLRHFSDEEISLITQTDNFRLILDGQQRITSIYRALLGIDKVFLILKNNPSGEALEEYIDSFAGEQKEDRICVHIHDVYLADKESWRESKQFEQFKQTRYAKVHANSWSQKELDRHFEIYLKVVNLLKDLFKREKLVAYYLLDMGLDKFTLFFERSNSRGIQLNFTDILAAKLYSGFNLRAAIEDFEAQYPDIVMNRELIIRAVAYLTSDGRDVKKNYILTHLKPADFDRYWKEVCDLYVQSLKFLSDNYYILSQSWMPSENMLLPLMIFLREVKGKGFGESQRRFLEFWFWASVFSARYSTASNEVILEDAGILKKIARGETIRDTSYLSQLRSRIADADDILAYQKRANSIYKGLLNLVNFDQDGFLDWASRSRLTFNQPLEDHHIFPRAFIRKSKIYSNNDEAQELVNCVANRALIPKLQNLQIGARPPSEYLRDLQQKNPELQLCLNTHLISEVVMEPIMNDIFVDFVRQRAHEMFELVEKYAIKPAETFESLFPESQMERPESPIPVFAEYKGNRLEGAFYLYKKQIEFKGRSYSPSAAALAAIHHAGGTDRISENGWTFWRYRDEAGQEQVVDNLRDMDYLS